ncbi:hypothetical protein SAMN05216593_101451 [Pseudomonas asturiensis]|uniref:Uncharacterized protein n=1 Tax=Pseudomonas asturiensis TaxID=1190415 RepID=A0A1M7JP93_9PSED|nr:hypothetical protein [Pseudomonas asturiensis]SHM54367.1 hypothetical protein SAMN05216593_101451 [Pseudomonas asturiensis]
MKLVMHITASTDDCLDNPNSQIRNTRFIAQDKEQKLTRSFYLKEKSP